MLMAIQFYFVLIGDQSMEFLPDKHKTLIITTIALALVELYYKKPQDTLVNMSDLIQKFSKCSYYILDFDDNIIEQSDDYYDHIQFGDKKMDFQQMVRSIGGIKFTRHFIIFKQGKPILNEKGLPIIIDVTIEKHGNGKFVHLQNSDKSRQNTLEQVSSKIDLNIAKVAHDVRTPINSILMSNDCLLTDENMPHQFKDSLKQQNSSCQFIMNLMEGLIDVSKLSSDKFDQNYSWFNMQSILKDVFGMLEYLAQHHNTTMSYSFG